VATSDAYNLRHRPQLVSGSNREKALAAATIEQVRETMRIIYT
jgi:hypothetical protein